MQRTLQNKLTAGTLNISSAPSDPYRDIAPTGKYELRQGEGMIPCLTGADTSTGTVVHSYAPDGTWVGVMTERRFQFLRARWLEFWAGDRGKQTAEKMGITRRTLEREIADLLRRYKPGSKKGDGSKVDLKNHWAVRTSLRSTIVHEYQVSCEAFASPLNCMIGDGAPMVYCSAHPRDVIFGAKYDAYAQNPSILSAYMNPEYTEEELLRALKWAVAASQFPEPFSAVLVIPRFQMAKYMDLLQHRNVSLIAKAERGTFSFMAPTHWELGDQDPEGKNTAKWQVMFVEVANQAGQEFKRSGAWDRIRQAIVDTGATLAQGEDVAFIKPQCAFKVNTPTVLRKWERVQSRVWPEGSVQGMRIAAKRAAWLATGPQWSNRSADMTDTNDVPWIAPGELAARQPGMGTLVFTDGSKMGDEVGAGYVIPTDPTHCQHFTDSGEQLFPGCTMKVAGPQSVNRAELTAILAVLQDMSDDTDCTIYTDSKVSIQNIQRWAADPTQLSGDKHEALLREVAHRLAHRKGNTRLLKIMAHKGHPGNEAADSKAKQAATLAEGPDNRSRGVQEAGASLDNALYMNGQVISNVKKELRPVIQQRVATRGKWGTVTHEMWSGEQPELEDIDPKPSNVHWRPGKSKPKSLIKHIFRMRGNDYMCNFTKWLHTKESKRHTVSRLCPYGCLNERTGEPWWDTWKHTFMCKASGADKLTTMRHNAACQIIAAAIGKGSKGRWRLLQNFGKQDGAPEEKTVPEWVLPAEVRGPGPLDDKPDFVMVEGLGRHAPDPPSPIPYARVGQDEQVDSHGVRRDTSVKLSICEVKYGDDIRMRTKHAEARNKYEGDTKLTDILTRAGWRVEGLHTVVVGHRATVSASNRSAFAGMGITKVKEQDALQEKLAESAAWWARKIVNHTRKYRANHPGGATPPT